MLSKLKLRILMITIIFILSLIFLTGCWDRLEPEKLAIVTGGGFDYNPETEMYQLVFQIASPLTMTGADQGGGGSEKPNYWTVSAWGHTLYDALSNLYKKVSRRIDFSHAQLYIISERMARTKGVLPVINAVARSRGSRRIIIPAVAKENVEKVLTVDLPIESSNVMGLVNQITLTMEEMGGATAENFRLFFNKLSQPGIEPYVVALELIEDEDNKKEESKAGMKPPIEIVGKYIFRKDKVVGLLNDRETRGCNWVVGKVKQGTLIVQYPGSESTYVNILATEGSSRIEPLMENGKPKIKITIRMSGNIVNITGPSDIKKESALTESLKKRMAQVVRNDIELAIKKAKSVKSDIFGFGNAFYRLKYEEWLKMEDNWSEIFTTIPVEIEVKAEIKRMGMVNRGVEIR